MAFPQRKYYRLETLQKRWSINNDDISYAIENGLLRACIWLPTKLVDKGYQNDNCFIITSTEYKEGLVALKPEDCRRIFLSYEAKVCCFKSLEEDNIHLKLSLDDPERAPLNVNINHLLVHHNDCVAFEEAYNIKPQDNNRQPDKPIEGKSDINLKQTGDTSSFTQVNNYQFIVFNNEKFTLGIMQASIIEKLHKASNTNNPWVHGKILLFDSGSQGQRLRDIFKSQRQWRKLIESNGKGYYRLNTQ